MILSKNSFDLLTANHLDLMFVFYKCTIFCVCDMLFLCIEFVYMNQILCLDVILFLHFY